VDTPQLAAAGIVGAIASIVIVHALPFGYGLIRRRRPPVSRLLVLGYLIIFSVTCFLGAVAAVIVGSDLPSGLLAGYAWQATFTGFEKVTRPAT
jgi:hypothetical protein